MPIGARIATAAGVNVPNAVSRAATRNSTQGINSTLPRTSRTPAATSRSMVPLRRATENR